MSPELHTLALITYGPKDGVRVSPNEKRLSSKKKLSSGSTVPGTCGGSMSKGIQDCVASGPEELRLPDDVSRPRRVTSGSGREVLLTLSDTSSIARALRVRGR